MSVARELDAAQIHRQAVDTLFDQLSELCEGAVTVDRDAAVVWINDRYRKLLGLGENEPVVGRPVAELIPESQLREVIQSGRPVLLDIMRFGERHFVVTRLPIRDAAGQVTGAVGFVLYDRLNQLRPLIARFEELRAQLRTAEQALARERRTRYGFAHIVGPSAAMAEVKRQARRCAQLDSPVLLLGETGTGKELLAQAIHAASPRASRPFVAINTVAIPDTLLEAELFGTAPGAFTGADRRPRAGKFRLADGGTLFLDEIGDMPQQLQAKLLRVLQEHEIEAVGSDRLEPVDVRIVAATSRDLRKLVADGRFRADLYYRLDVLPIRIPPLRERVEDIIPLAEHLLDDIAARNGIRPRELSPAAAARLEGWAWPGNVRELRNLLERACMLSDNTTLEQDDITTVLPAATAPAASAPLPSLADVLAEAERGHIRRALALVGGCKAEAARRLGISRSQLYARMQALGLS